MFGRGCDPLRNEPKVGPGWYLCGAGDVTMLLRNQCTQYIGLILGNGREGWSTCVLGGVN